MNEAARSLSDTDEDRLREFAQRIRSFQDCYAVAFFVKNNAMFPPNYSQAKDVLCRLTLNNARSHLHSAIHALLGLPEAKKMIVSLLEAENANTRT